MFPHISRYDIYWANSLFGEADRCFNKKYAVRLRALGYSVYLPQEADINLGTEKSPPSSFGIFTSDTRAILLSRLLVACLDQETIDSGVACEVGIAYAYGLPTIGLYTDIRQYREGRGRMYKNVYVIGAIENNGVIVSDEDELVRAIQIYLDKEGELTNTRLYETKVVSHFGKVAPVYSEYISKLESFYQPKWTAEEVVEQIVRDNGARRILEFGCATSSLGNHLLGSVDDLFYVGYDKSSKMTKLASALSVDKRLNFTSLWSDVVGFAKDVSFDMAVALFTLHDIKNKTTVISKLTHQITVGGKIVIIDLSSTDLPALTELLKRSLARPVSCDDMRLDPVSIAIICRNLDLRLLEYQIALPQIVFPTSRDVDDYLSIFGIYNGMDLPLGINGNHTQEYMNIMRDALTQLQYPFADQRVFTICVLQKV